MKRGSQLETYINGAFFPTPMEDVYRIPLWEEPYLPNLVIKIDKNGKFLFCVALTVLHNGESVEVSRIDNYHVEEKRIHIHKHKTDSQDTEGEVFIEEVEGFPNAIGKAIEHYIDN